MEDNEKWVHENTSQNSAYCENRSNSMDYKKLSLLAQDCNFAQAKSTKPLILWVCRERSAGNATLAHLW